MDLQSCHLGVPVHLVAALAPVVDGEGWAVRPEPGAPVGALQGDAWRCDLDRQCLLLSSAQEVTGSLLVGEDSAIAGAWKRK